MFDIWDNAWGEEVWKGWWIGSLDVSIGISSSSASLLITTERWIPLAPTKSSFHKIVFYKLGGKGLVKIIYLFKANMSKKPYHFVLQREKQDKKALTLATFQ